MYGWPQLLILFAESQHDDFDTPLTRMHAMCITVKISLSFCSCVPWIDRFPQKFFFKKEDPSIPLRVVSIEWVLAPSPLYLGVRLIMRNHTIWRPRDSMFMMMAIDQMVTIHWLNSSKVMKCSKVHTQQNKLNNPIYVMPKIRFCELPCLGCVEELQQLVCSGPISESQWVVLWGSDLEHSCACV